MYYLNVLSKKTSLKQIPNLHQCQIYPKSFDMQKEEKWNALFQLTSESYLMLSLLIYTASANVVNIVPNFKIKFYYKDVYV